ncbi:MAG: MATE family efflux transporter [Pseudomonadota bacterium]
MNFLSRKDTIDMGAGKVSSTLFRLAVPSMISLFFQNLYSLVDTVFVSWVGTEALAALSISVPVFYLALALAKGVGIGTTTLMSHARGRGETDRADSLARYSLTLMFFILSPMLIFALPGPSRMIFGLLGAKGGVRVEVYHYALWMALSFPVMGYVTLCESVFMSHGDSLTPMKGMLLGNIVNLIMDPVLIFGAGLGVGGASMASLMGWICSGLYLRKRLLRMGFTGPSAALTPAMLPYWRAVWEIGYMIALSMVIIPFSFGTLNWLLARIGAAPLGAWNLMSRVEMMIALPLMGVGNALVPFIGYNLGRKACDRIRGGVWFSLVIGISIMAFFSVLFIIFSKQVMEMFHPGPEVLQWGAYALRVSATAYVLFPVELTLIGLSQGLKKPAYSLLSMAFRQLGLRIPLAVLLSHTWGAKGIYWSHPASMALTGLLCILLILNLLKKTKISMAGAGGADY